MGRLIAILLGGAALAFYVPLLLPEQLGDVTALWQKLLGTTTEAGIGWYERIEAAGGGIFAGIGLVLLAVRGRD